MWQSGKLAFAVQMMLMLVLGHILALSQPVESFLNHLVKLCDSNKKAAIYTTFFTILISLFNWGLGLIFGAIFARKIGEHAQKNHIPINYPLIGACAYVGLMVWHGGISGSAPIKVAESGHLKSLVGNSLSSTEAALLPDVIAYGSTVFSTFNLITCLILLIVIPSVAFLISKRNFQSYSFQFTQEHGNSSSETPQFIDRSKIFLKLFGGIILAGITYNIFLLEWSEILSFKFVTPNFINLTLLALCFVFHSNALTFLHSCESAIGGVSGILIQFPLYFGIMGLMVSSGLIQNISDWIITHASASTLPLFTYFSAALVNIFVPSGGGQWMVQGPILIKSSISLGVPLNKTVMALSYGDQITNMLQPFWALPLLGITKLKAQDILPYCLIFFLVGSSIFALTILLF